MDGWMEMEIPSLTLVPLKINDSSLMSYEVDLRSRLEK